MTNNSVLQESLAPWLNAINGTIGIYAMHRQKVVVSHNSDQSFYLASTYKIPIAVQCLRHVDKGLVKLDQWVEVHPQDIPEYSPILDHRHFSFPGIKLNVQNLIRLMLEYSDNTASDLILELAGGIPAVKKFLEEHGFAGEISIDMTIKEAFLETQATDSHDSATPKAMVKFLNELFTGKFLSLTSNQFLLECMQRCKTGNARIRALLPEGTLVASKTGTLTGYVNDIGIIDLPDDKEKLFLAIYIKETSASQKEGENVIANISKIIFDHALST